MNVFITFSFFISLASGNEIFPMKIQLAMKNISGSSSNSNSSSSSSFPVKILWKNPNDKSRSLSINKATIERIFLHPEITGRKIVVVSIRGENNSDLTLLLDLLLRFSYANVS